MIRTLKPFPLSFFAAATLFFLSPVPCRSADESDDAWVNLFDGKDLEGWVQRGGKAKYRAENGEIVGTSVPGTANSFLCTKKNYSNFILELEFKVDPGLNSGVQIRSECFDRDKTVEFNGQKIRIPAGRAPGILSRGGRFGR
jgi:hypothetical protein